MLRVTKHGKCYVDKEIHMSCPNCGCEISGEDGDFDRIFRPNDDIMRIGWECPECESYVMARDTVVQNKPPFNLSNEAIERIKGAFEKHLMKHVMAISGSCNAVQTD